VNNPLAAIVVKLGGSLAGDPSLAHWLRELAGSRAARFVAVPGGGPFADIVRAAQGIWRFSDEVAHTMAIGAMDQFGRMLCGIESGSVPCSTLDEIEAAWSRRVLPVWLPGRAMDRERELARSWDVTSDTIAAWLADALGASGLVLVKSCDLPAGPCEPAGLAAAGIVDPTLPEFLKRSRLALQVVQRGRWGELDRIATRFSCRV
jgi:5-(aminomethyl)-3-furanmethanol phosphate kinase